MDKSLLLRFLPLLIFGILTQNYGNVESYTSLLFVNASKSTLLPTMNRIGLTTSKQFR